MSTLEASEAGAVMSDVSVDLRGKCIVVTGASSGMGAAIVRAVAASGGAAVGVGRDPGRLRQSIDAAAAAGGSALGVETDLLAPGAADVVVTTAVEAFGRIDGIVHAGGVFWPKPFAETSADELEGQWRTHVQAPYLLTQRALEPLRSSRGAVVFFSSIFGTVGAASCSAYCASKGAVALLTQSLAAELGPDGVNVNCIAPGAVETPMNEDLRRNEPGMYETHRDGVPARRWGVVDDITGPTLFLLSAAADFVHGQVLHVDGGYVAQ